MKWMTTYEINLHKPDSQEYISPLIHTGKRLTSTTYIESASTSKPLEIKTAEVVELVDTTDSKSVAFAGLGVRVPPSVPNQNSQR